MGILNKEFGTIFLKEDSGVGEYIKKLEELRDKSTGKLRERLEKDIYRARRGKAGEDAVAEQLKYCGLDMYVLRDIYLKTEDLVAQIDYIVVTSKSVYVIECKNLNSDIMIDKNDNFAYVNQEKGKQARKKSPIVQNRKHKLVMERLWNNRFNIMTQPLFEKPIEIKPLLVITNSEKFLHLENARMEIKDQVTHIEQLEEHIKRLDEKVNNRPMKKEKMEDIANFYKSCNQEERPDYTKKYSVNLNEKKENRGNIVYLDVPYEKKEEAKALGAKWDKKVRKWYITQNMREQKKGETMYPKRFCPKCKAELVIKIAKKGKNQGTKFYGCSNYPDCKYSENI